MAWEVPALWQDERCFIIGGGTSIPYQFDVPQKIINNLITGISQPNILSDYMQSIHKEFVIGVNNAYKIGNWIDFIFFGDCSWYYIHREALAKFPGVKVTCCKHFAKNNDNPGRIKYLAKDRRDIGISNNLSRIGWNKNSGAASISLAVHLGVKQIILLGFDMDLKDNISHWFGSHKKRPTTHPPFKRHLQGFPQIQKDAINRGIEILNASPKSKIMSFRKVNLKDIL